MGSAGPKRNQPLVYLAVVLVALLGIVVGIGLTQPGDGGGQQRYGMGAGCQRVSLEISSSTEKWAIIDTAARAYSGDVHSIEGVRYCATVTVHPLTSGQAAQALTEGWRTSKSAGDPPLPVPDVWTPTSSMWADLVRADRGRLPDVVPAPQPSPDPPYPVLARSAVVFAMPRDKADALRKGLKGRALGWSDLRRLSRDSWGNPDESSLLHYGDGDWLRFRFRKDDPRTSTSGLAATVSTYEEAYHAITGGTLQSGDIPNIGEKLTDQRIVDFLRQVEDGMDPAGYPVDGTQMMRDLTMEDRRSPGWKTISAVIVQEQLAYRYNVHDLLDETQHPDRETKEALTGGPVQPLVPFYLSGGTLMMDHPYIELSGLSLDKHRVAADFGGYLRSQPALFTAKGFRDAYGVPSDALRKALGDRFVANPQPQQHTPSGPTIRAILDSWNHLRKRANLVLLMDVSDSMKAPLPSGNRLTAAKAAANAAVDRVLDRGDRIEVRAFAAPRDRTGTTVLYHTVFPSTRLGDDKTELKNAIDSIQLGWQLQPPLGKDTPLFANIRLAHAYLEEHWDPDAINAVVVLTDGANDDGFEPTKNPLFKEFADHQTPVPVYCIAFGSEVGPLGDLREIAYRSGNGQIVDATPGEGHDSIEIAFLKGLSVG